MNFTTLMSFWKNYENIAKIKNLHFKKKFKIIGNFNYD